MKSTQTIFVFLLLTFCNLALPLTAESPSLIFENEDQYEIIINNRVLININQKPITVLDVMKKLDTIFYKQFPEYANSKAARFQFYTGQWKAQLKEMVNKELILADAAESKMEISKGDIRQEIETLFGPNIIDNLDKAGLTTDEAWDLVKEDITLRRIIMAKVNSKAMRRARPQSLREAYREYSKENVRPEMWVYRVVSIREPDVKMSSETAHLISILLDEDHIELDDLQQELKENHSLPSSTSVSISEEFKHPVKDISESYKEVLSTLEPRSSRSYSSPVAHKGRKDNKTIHRIFHLKEIIPEGVSPLKEVVNTLRDRIIQKAVEEETDIYFRKLYRHFGIDENTPFKHLPEDFQPFRLQKI